MSFRLLTEDDVRAVLPSSRFPELVDLMQSALRDFSEGRVVFKSLGLAVEDVVTGSLVWRDAVAAGLGRELAL